MAAYGGGGIWGGGGGGFAEKLTSLPRRLPLVGALFEDDFGGMSREGLRSQQRAQERERRARIDPLVKSLMEEGKTESSAARRAMTQRVEQQYGAESRAMASRGLAQTFGGMSPAMARARGRGIESRRQTGMVQAEAMAQDVMAKNRAAALQAILREMGIEATMDQLYARLIQDPTFGERLIERVGPSAASSIGGGMGSAGGGAI
jgi:MarR-like DNA-binding transcriptional regulator SgrR of sgrS sRNA